MATKHSTAERIELDHRQSWRGLLLAVYLGVLLATVAAATIGAAVLAGATSGLGGFVLVAAGWLAVVSASTSLSGRVAGWVLSRFGAQSLEGADRRTAAVAAQFVSK